MTTPLRGVSPPLDRHWLPRLVRAVACASTLSAGVPACNTADPQATGPRMSLIDSVLLAESSTTYLGRPGGLHIDSLGRIYVSDLLTERILRFDAAGQFDKAFGAAGSGPGEFRGIGDVLLVWDHVLAVQSYGHRRISFLDMESGRSIADIRYAGTLTSGTHSDSLAWFGNLDPVTRFGVIRFDLNRLRGSEPSAMPVLASTVSPIPEAYVTNEILRGTYGLVQVSSWSDTVLVGYAAENHLVAYDKLGHAVDTSVVPARNRRGVPKDLLKRMNFATSSYAEMFEMASALFGVWRRPKGGFFLVYMDSKLEGKRSIRSTGFLSLLSPDRSEACVDAPIPASGEGQPKVTARGDTLFVLDQYTLADQPRVLSVVRKYLIDESRCDWLATRGDRVR